MLVFSHSITAKKLFFSAMLALIFCFLLRAQPCAAQESAVPATTVESAEPPAGASDEVPALFPHFGDKWPIWLSGQMNFISQAHPEFHAAYSGRNSFGPDYEKGTSRIMTLYTGLRLNHAMEVLADV